MKPLITICYLTNRNNPRFEWFLDSFINQYKDEVPIEIIIIDGSENPFRYMDTMPELIKDLNISAYRPKPTSWQGEHRVTTQNYFAASNARNTGIIYAKGDYIVFVDDLSVLLPGWWTQVVKAYKENYIVFGAYKKVGKLVVEDGKVESFEELPAGNDSRYWQGSRWCRGDLLFGCSFGAPIEWLLSINGLDEICDGMGYEDTNLGLRLEKKGYRMFYDMQMMTYESEEAHHEETSFLRVDKLLTEEQYNECRERLGITGWYQQGGRTDCSHLLMDMIRTNDRTLSFGEGTKEPVKYPQDPSWTWGNGFVLRQLRETKDFPLPHPNTRHWPDLQKLSEM